MTIEWTSREILLAGDLTGDDISSLLRAGKLHRLRRGRYVAATDWTTASSQAQHCVRARELGSATAGQAAVSHESAALLHGLHLPPGCPRGVHLTWPGSTGRSTSRNITPHRAALAPREIVRVGDVWLTSVARTVFDVGRLGVWDRAVSVADSALRLGLCTREELVDVLERHPRIPGAFRARRTIEFADPLAESVGESVCRVAMAQIGLPQPTLQSVITGARASWRYRVDFDFAPMHTIAEFDGRVKYGRLLAPGQDSGDAVFAEKVREDRIRETGRQVVRVTWADLNQPDALLARFAAAFRRAGFPDWRPTSPRFLSAPVSVPARRDLPIGDS